MRYIELDRRREAVISQQANTYIGGVSSTINTRSALASKLNIPIGNISYFKTVGNNVLATITSTYAIPANAFLNNTNITQFIDASGKSLTIGDNAFKGATSFNYGYFSGVVTLGTSYVFRSVTGGRYIFPNTTNIPLIPFYDLYGAAFIHIPKATQIGSSEANNNVFYQIGAGKIIANTAKQTSNGGGLEGDLAYAQGRGATIRFRANETKPANITDLAHNASILTFNTPSSTNTIDFYEVFVNGFYKQDISGSGSSVSGLVAGDKVVVYACDIYYNRSISNEITI